MAIHDSDPERRNVLVTSLAFVAYYFAGGSFTDTSLKLQVVNVEFEKPLVLGILAWIMLLWFIYRYWLTHNGKFNESFPAEFSEWRQRRYVIEYVRKNAPPLEKGKEEEELILERLAWSKWRVIGTCVHARNVERNEKGQIQSYSRVPVFLGGKESASVKFLGFEGWVLALRATFECIWRYPSFSNYLIPYALAILAVAGGVSAELF